jgi:hypothetical protein
MKKVILLLLIAAVVFSCKKNEPTAPDVKKEAEVSFNVTTILPDAGRDFIFTNDVPPCDPDAIPTYAKIKIDGIEGPDPGPGGDPTTGYWDVPVFWTNNNLYTQAIKLPVNEEDCIEVEVNGGELICCTDYVLTEFYLYDANDVIIKAAPLPGSDFQEFVENALPLEFEVCAFEKIELYIDVLCFIPDVYDLFGFFWFEITEITVREMCYFGDICVDWFDYNIEGDKLLWWEEYATGYDPIEADMPAIFELSLKKWIDLNNDGVIDHPDELFVIDTWNNLEFQGTGMPLCMRYADYDHETDVFFVTLFIWAPYGPDGVFSFGPPDDPHGNMIWQFTDDGMDDNGTPDDPSDDFHVIDLNGDGVVEFAWGDCVQAPEWLLPYNPQGK